MAREMPTCSSNTACAFLSIRTCGRRTCRACRRAADHVPEAHQLRCTVHGLVELLVEHDEAAEIVRPKAGALLGHEVKARLVREQKARLKRADNLCLVFGALAKSHKHVATDIALLFSSPSQKSNPAGSAGR